MPFPKSFSRMMTTMMAEGREEMLRGQQPVHRDLDLKGTNARKEPPRTGCFRH